MEKRKKKKKLSKWLLDAQLINQEVMDTDFVSSAWT